MCTGLGLGRQSPTGPTLLSVSPAQQRDHLPPCQKRREPAGPPGTGCPSAGGREASADSSQTPEQEEGCWEKGSAPPRQQGTPKCCTRLATTLTTPAKAEPGCPLPP